MQRREFIKAIAGLLIAWPLAVFAQQAERMRRIGVLSALGEDDPEWVSPPRGVRAGAAGLGLERRTQPADRLPLEPALIPTRIQKFAAELAALAPDVILASSNVVIAPMLQAARTTPIVLTQVIDPVGSGFVESMARPGGNVTGFTLFEYSLAGKWLELLKEIAPHVTRVGGAP